MKTPDAIKKGLEFLSITNVAEKVAAAKKGLPYAYTEEVAADAFAYIQQLEADNAQLLENVEQLEEDIKNIREGNPIGAVALVGRKLLARLQSQIPRWISVEERLPEEGVRVNVVLADGYTSVAQRLTWGWFIYVYGKSNVVRYWMPLPELPED